MKKSKKYIAIVSSLSILTMPCWALSSAIQSINLRSDEKQNDENLPIPENFLDIDENNILYGFKPGITLTDIIEGGFDTLEIPKQVVKIANTAFDHAFTLKQTKIRNLILNENLVEIGSAAFKRCHGFVNIDFSKARNLEKIGEEAFYACNYWGTDSQIGEYDKSTLQLPTSLKEVGASAFRQCQSIQKIIVPSSIENVGAFAFAACDILHQIDFTAYDNIPNWMYKPGQQIFQNNDGAGTLPKGQVKINLNDCTLDQWKDVIYNRLEINKEKIDIDFGSYTPPECFTINKENNEITEVKDLSNYKIIKIPEKIKVGKEEEVEVQKLAVDLFKGKIATKTTIILPEGLTTIGESCFEGCTNLHGEVVLPTTITTIGKNAFKDCTNITGTVRIPDSISPADGIGESCFENCSNLTGVAFDFNGSQAGSSDAVQVGKRAFANCKRLSLIDIRAWPDAADLKFTPFKNWDRDKNPDENPFYSIAKTGHILAKTGGIGQTALLEKLRIFQEDFSFANLKVEERGLSSSSNDREDKSEWLLSVYGRDVEQEKSWYQPFDKDKDFIIKNISHLVSLTPDARHIANIGQNGKTTINIPNTVTDIEDNAFQENFVSKIGLDNAQTWPKYWFLLLNDGLLNIGNYAFADNPGISGELTLPYSLRTIGDFAFSQCHQIRGDLALSPQLEYIGDGAFFNCVGMYTINLNIPNTLYHIGTTPFFGMGIQNIKIPFSAKEIGDYAFMGIYDLQTIDLTSFPKIPTDYEWSSTAFYTNNLSSIKNKKVYVTGDTKPWEDFLKNHGLDTTQWNVTN